MKNLKLDLFNFRKKLTYDENDISTIIESHMDACNNFNNKDIILSLNERLKTYTFDKSVKKLLESLNDDLSNYQLIYELKNLYNVLNTKNQGELYRQPINVLLQTINLDNDTNRMSKILNELAIYDWVPEIRLFVHNLTKSPQQKSNLLSGGNSESIYTLVEQVENGYMAYVKDSWFLMTENNIEKTLLESHVKDSEKLKILRNLEIAMKYANITDDRINFKISENMVIGLSADKKGVIYINDDETHSESTLESIFQSSIIPIVNRNFYPIILETAKNITKFVELDVVQKVSNLINPYLEVYAFNYKNSTYVYKCDERYGKSFYKYESALELVNEVKNDLNYDLTYFYEKKLSKEVITQRKLEDKEKEVSLKLEEINLNIDKIKSSVKLIGESKTLTIALNNLIKRKEDLDAELEAIKEIKYKEKIRY